MAQRRTVIAVVMAIIAIAGIFLVVGVDGNQAFKLNPPNLPLPEFSTPSPEPSAAAEVVEDLRESEQKSNWLPKVLGLLAFIVVLVLLRIAQRKLTTFLGDRRTRESIARGGSELEDAPALNEVLIPHVQQALDSGLEFLRSDLPPRNAIIAAWQELEKAAENSGLERSAAHTPTEFTMAALDQLALPADQLSQLLSLFHQARFTDHAIEPDDSERAQHIFRTLSGHLVGSHRTATEVSSETI